MHHSGSSHRVGRPARYRAVSRRSGVDKASGRVAYAGRGCVEVGAVATMLHRVERIAVAANLAAMRVAFPSRWIQMRCSQPGFHCDIVSASNARRYSRPLRYGVERQSTSRTSSASSKFRFVLTTLLTQTTPNPFFFFLQLERLLASHSFSLPVSRAEAAAAGYSGSYGNGGSGGGGGGRGSGEAPAIEYTRSGAVLGGNDSGGGRSHSLGVSGQVRRGM